VIEIDAASNTQVDNVRNVIINTIAISPARDRHKIFIIDEVHMLSGSSFNALLKTLEEPPSHVVFIMATTELHKVPETILSRCQVFEFRTIALGNIVNQLRSIAGELGVKITDAALMAVARAGEGSMRDAQSALDQVISFSGNNVSDKDVSDALGLVDLETLHKTMSAVAEEDSQQTLLIVEEVVSRGYDLRNFCRELMSHIRALLVVKIAGFDSELVQMPQGEGEKLAQIANVFSEQDLVRFFSILTKTEQDIRASSQPRFQLEIGLVKLAQARRLYMLEDALNRISDLESKIGGSGALPSGSAPPSSKGTSGSTGGKVRLPQRPQQQSAPAVTRPTVSEAPSASPFPSASEPVYKEPSPPPAPPPVEHTHAEPVSQQNDTKPAPGLEKSRSNYEPPPLEESYEVVHEMPLISARSGAAATEVEANAAEKVKAALERRRKMMMLSMLDKAESITVKDDSLHIAFSPNDAMYKTKFELRENRSVIEEVCEEIFGRPMTVLVTAGGQATAQPASTPKPRKPSAKQQVEDHPGIKALVDKFRGEVVDVIKPET
jgi:DNA polymerase-3 subunit gamma/tau